MTTNGDDYIFRFKLDSTAPVESGVDLLSETIRSFLDDFSKMGFFTHEGRRVPVDGFTLLNDKETIHRIFSEEG